MNRSETRYKRVWDAGYRAAAADIDEVFGRFLREGGQIVVAPFSGEFVIKGPTGWIATGHSLLALCRFGERRSDR